MHDVVGVKKEGYQLNRFPIGFGGRTRQMQMLPEGPQGE